MLLLLLLLATEGVQIGTGHVGARYVRVQFRHLRPLIIANQLIIPIPTQRFDHIQPRFNVASGIGSGGGGCVGGSGRGLIAGSSRSGWKGWRHGGRAFFVERCRRFTQIVNDLLVQMVIGSRQVTFDWLWSR